MQARPLSFYIWLHYYVMLVPTVVLIGIALWLGLWWLAGVSVVFMIAIAAVKYKLMRDLERDVAGLVSQAEASSAGEHIEPLRTVFAEINKLSATFVEVERDRLLIIEELRHRGRNTLAKVQGLIVPAIRNSPDTVTAAERVFELVAVLQRQDNLLVRHGMRGASLKEVFEEELEFQRKDHRIVLDGPPVLLDSSMAEVLGVVAHELATNAVKYGSLRDARGSVKICWQVVAGVCTLTWSEQGTPPQEQEEVAGFGSYLVERMLHRLGATVYRRLSADGLKFAITFPYGKK